MLTVTTIPLNQLVPSAANVRRTHPGVRVEELAASIAAHGLLQNLTVRLAPKGKRRGRKADAYEVVAGGRRLAALKLLATRMTLAADTPIPCHVLVSANVTEISLAENALQAPMHPADQFDAFFVLHGEHGMSAEDIAARFGVTAAVVKQRLKLAAISPALVEAYRAGEMNLDQLTAFAITDDHAKQERVWAECGYNDSRDTLLAALTDEHVAADDRGARFVGVAAYVAAGGAILRDLFDAEGDGFLADPDLLDRLVREKLQAVADTVQAEGWKWVAVMRAFDYAATAGMRRIYPHEAPLSDAAQAKLDALEAEYAALEEADESDVTQADIDRLEQAMADLRGEECYDPADIAIAGVIVTLTHAGEPRIERGFIRAEDDVRIPAPRPRSAASGPAPLSAKLVGELTAYRTLALRDVLGDQPKMALIAVVHALAAATFFSYATRLSCLEIGCRSFSLGTHAPGSDDSPTAARLAQRHAAWASRLPDDPARLWDCIATLDADDRLALLAHCAALTVQAVIAPQDRERDSHPHADQVARAIRLDMRDHWQATGDSYFERVNRERILDAVREGISPAAADNLAKLKKGALAEMADQRLQGSGWLPPLLRTPAAPVADETTPLAA